MKLFSSFFNNERIEDQKNDLAKLTHQKLEKKWQPTPVFLPGKSHGQRSLVGYRPWDYKCDDLETKPPTQLKHSRFRI